MSNWLQSLNESYQNLKEEQQLQNNLAILAEDIHKDDPTLSEQQVYNILTNVLNEMLAPGNWAAIHGDEAGRVRQGRKDKVAKIAAAAQAAITPAGRGIWGALKRTFSGKEKRLQVLSQHSPDFLAKQLVLKPEERHESLRGMKDKHIRQHLENHAKAAQAKELHSQLGGQHDNVVPEDTVRRFEKATERDASAMGPGLGIQATSRNTKGSRKGYEGTPLDLGHGEVDKQGKPVYRKEHGTGEVSDIGAPFPAIGVRRGSVDPSTGKVLTGQETDNTGRALAGIKHAMRRGGVIKTSGTTSSGDRVEVTSPATLDNMRKRADSLTKSGEAGVKAAQAAGKIAAAEAERKQKELDAAAKAATAKPAEGAPVPTQPQASGRKPRQPRKPRG